MKKILILALMLFSAQASFGVHFDRKLETVCGNCSSLLVRSLPQYKSYFSSPFEQTKDRKDFIIVIDHTYNIKYYEGRVLQNIHQQLVKTQIGKNLLRKLNNKHYFKILHHLSGDLFLNGDSLWEQERRNPHELFGYFAARRSESVVTLNLYQHIGVAVMTYIHELFHLFDPYFKKVSNEKVPSKVENFIVEYRAYLAELTFYLQKKQLRESSGWQMVSANGEDSFHEKFIKRGKINYNALYNYLLNLQYPINSKNMYEWRVQVGSKADLKVVDEYGNLLKESSFNVVENNINKVIHRVLTEFLLKDKSNQFKVLLKLTYSKQSLQANFSENKKTQNEIKRQIGKNIYSYLKENNLLNLNLLTDDPVEGIISGPKERGMGD